MTGSLRENIVFFRKYDEKRYARVLEACQLLPDLEQLPHGDETFIGERGVNLSGGQRQRVSLARAAYGLFECSLVVLDDVLSALDARVGRKVIEELILGEMREHGVLLVTHSLQVCSRSTRVVVLQDGLQVQSGTYEELMALGPETLFRTMMKDYVEDQEGKEGDDVEDLNDENDDEGEEGDDLVPLGGQTMTKKNSEYEEEGNQQRLSGWSTTEEATEEKKEQPGAMAEEGQVGGVASDVWLRYLAKIGWSRVALIVALTMTWLGLKVVRRNHFEDSVSNINM